jgi:hypothetical protein
MTNQLIDRALTAQRESRRIEFRDGFDPASERDWTEIVRDVAALANSGGGVILFGVDRSGNPTGSDLAGIDSEAIAERLYDATGIRIDLEAHDLRKRSQQVVALLVDEAETPLVLEGRAFFRHGSRSEPGTTADVAAMMNRRLVTERRSWLAAVRRVLREPAPILPSEIRESESPQAVPIRVVDDPRAQAFRLVDYDKTHPYRQKELLAELRLRNPGLNINQFDLLAVRHAHDTDARPEFSHKGLFGTRQYSPKFLDWLQEQITQNPRFLLDAREQYQKARLA